MYKPKIITFEGIDGSGKTTHILKVKKFLKSKKISFHVFREPGGSKNSEIIRRIILNKKNNFEKFTDLLLYMASRNENMKMIEKYKNKKVILIDRFIHSSLAYQHYGMGVKSNIINKLNKLIIKDIKISFTFLNIVNKKNLKRRFTIRKKLNRYDRFSYKFYSKVQNGYLKLSNKENNKFLIINSNENIIDNQKLINNKIKAILNI